MWFKSFDNFFVQHEIYMRDRRSKGKRDLRLKKCTQLIKEKAYCIKISWDIVTIISNCYYSMPKIIWNKKKYINSSFRWIENLKKGLLYKQFLILLEYNAWLQRNYKWKGSLFWHKILNSALHHWSKLILFYRKLFFCSAHPFCKIYCCIIFASEFGLWICIGLLCFVRIHHFSKYTYFGRLKKQSHNTTFNATSLR